MARFNLILLVYLFEEVTDGHVIMKLLAAFYLRGQCFGRAREGDYLNLILLGSEFNMRREARIVHLSDTEVNLNHLRMSTPSKQKELRFLRACTRRRAIVRTL